MSLHAGRSTGGGEQSTLQPDAAESRAAARASAVLRLILVPIVFICNHVIRHPAQGTVAFDVILAVAVLYSLLVLAFTWRRTRSGIAHGGKLAIDLALISALAFFSGRGFPQIRAAFLLAPMAAAISLTPRRTAVLSVADGAAYILVALLHPVRQPLAVSSVLTHSMWIGWSGVAAVVMATLRDRRERKIVDLAQVRGRLVAQIIETEERVRKRVSGVLHDNVIQDLLTARQDLAEAGTGDEHALHRAEYALDLALGQLRHTIENLDPYLLDHLELPSVIDAIADRETRRGSCRVDVRVQPQAAGAHDGLIASLSRELLSNAAKHSGATRTALSLTRQGEILVLEVTDDGRGFTQTDQVNALRSGHIGLAATKERVEATGGSFHIETSPGAGSRIKCILPVIDDTVANAGSAGPRDARTLRTACQRFLDRLPGRRAAGTRLELSPADDG